MQPKACFSADRFSIRRRPIAQGGGYMGAVLLLESVSTQLLRPRFQLKCDFDHPPNPRYGIELLLDSRFKEGEFTLEVVRFVNDDEYFILGTEMLKRIRGHKCLGQRQAEAMLRNQERIPEEWQDYWLVFPASQQRESGVVEVPFIKWTFDRWLLYQRGLPDGFGQNCRVVVLGE